MFRLDCQIVIVSNSIWSFDKVISIEIEQDQKTLTDTCKITIPPKFKWGAQSRIPIKQGDEVTVMMGYDGDLKMRFKGYVRKVGAKNPLVIECEDQMWTLKKMAPRKMQHRNVTLKKLVDSWGLAYKVNVVDDLALGNYIVTLNSVAQELDALRKNWGVRSFFTLDATGEPVLNMGVVVAASNQVAMAVREGLNMIENNMDYADVTNMRIKAVSILPSNKRMNCEVGERNGELRTIYKYGLTKQELEMAARKELERLQKGGMKGRITTFGEPVIGNGQRVWMEAKNGVKGYYMVRKIEIKFGTSGYRQVITVEGI